VANIVQVAGSGTVVPTKRAERFPGLAEPEPSGFNTQLTDPNVLGGKPGKHGSVLGPTWSVKRIADWPEPNGTRGVCKISGDTTNALSMSIDQFTVAMSARS